MYVTYVRLLVVVPKCKTFACGYMQCVCNKCIHIEAQLQHLFSLGHVPFTYGTSSICYCLQDTLFNSVMGTYHYPHISLTFYNCVYWDATNYTLPECLLLFHYCLHTLNMTLFLTV